MLTFDEATHTYRWNGVRVPSVTQIMAPLHDWSRVPPAVLRAAQERGTYVHKLTEAYDLGLLDEAAMLADPQHARFHGYLRAWKAFLQDHDPRWFAIEQPMYSARLKYAGTPDRRGSLHGSMPGVWTIDIKTATDAHEPWGVQTAAYRSMFAEQDPEAALDRRGTVQLAADGSYELLPWTSPDDWSCFTGLLAVHQWQEARR